LDIANSAAGSTPSEKILNELLAEPLAPQLRIDVLNAVCPRLGHFNYGLNEPGSYQKFKQIRLEIMQLTEQNHLSGNSVYASTADMAFFYGDYDFANQMLKK